MQRLKLRSVGVVGGFALASAIGLMMGQGGLRGNENAMIVGVTGFDTHSVHVAIAWRQMPDGKLVEAGRGQTWWPIRGSKGPEELANEVIIPPTAPDDLVAAEADRQRRELGDISPALGVAQSRMQICAGSRVPDGWIKVDDQWSPTTCGNPSNIVYNVWTIERYDDKPKGSVMDVCASETTPKGWVEVGTAWQPTCCGHPANITRNVKRIQLPK